MIFLLTGDSGSGKTSLLNELAAIFRMHRITPGGFTAPGSWLNGARSGFVLHDLFHNNEYPLAETGGTGPEMQGHFVFNEKTLEFGNQLLINQHSDSAIDIIIVDEVGPFELRGKGWARSLDILTTSGKPQIWAVRPQLADRISDWWKLTPSFSFSVNENNPVSVFGKISDLCFNQKQ
ncbi:MAG: hypothetical protein IPH20_26960 [Bacteroidales bacterium]|nr:hypothetical protein [Bacteroidales bacterium]